MLNRLKVALYNRLHFLKIQELELQEAAIQQFEKIWTSIESGNFREYKSNYPISTFLNYLIENKNVLVHGTNHSNIEMFEPRKQTLFNGKPVTAVFAASDAIWSIFFAIIDRKKYKGSLRNMCTTIQTKKGLEGTTIFR